MKKLIQKIVFFFEMRSFGVSEWWAKKLGVRTARVRLFFIYSSFIALGSPLILYILMGLTLEYKHVFKLKKRRKSIWEL
ncbi:PspC family transcriptional regulator [Brumimicrobium salinarum]|uniref:PspC family transcriptional regulator n=1 Tax=Brumimicrobium salinarum TaxID=2058658 RepID=A0A2I0R0J9_9FLAO|nr:PspC family transcriptional regulator [Brumimicrobium salinarum]PKR80065.1 PspC family transcriptional regulator [Brumimicrobium salinarum]